MAGGSEGQQFKTIILWPRTMTIIKDHPGQEGLERRELDTDSVAATTATMSTTCSMYWAMKPIEVQYREISAELYRANLLKTTIQQLYDLYRR